LTPPSPDFLALFQAQAGPDGTLSFATFMELALYHPTAGYYQARRQRVGYEPGTDFFTASTSGPVFGELVSAACVTLLAGRDPREFAFVEIGAESGRGILKDVVHPFGSARAVGRDGNLELSGACIVFSNELFDAQPFRRFVFQAGAWRELGVALRDDRLVMVTLPTPTTTPELPAAAPEGYIIDAPLAAAALAAQIAAQPWHGLFVALDYGRSWRELVEATPAGTARAYFRHQQSNDLLARPGEQDLTCHVCWDWLAAALAGQGFASPRVESQESFFIRHAGDYIARVSAEEAAHFSRRKQSLLQLLHPSHLGQKFQALHALRPWTWRSMGADQAAREP